MKRFAVTGAALAAGLVVCGFASPGRAQHAARACMAGDQEACAALYEYAQDRCREGNFAGCGAARAMVRDGYIQPKRSGGNGRAVASRLLDGCERGDRSACAQVMGALRNGCRDGNQDACGYYAEFRRNGVPE